MVNTTLYLYPTGKSSWARLLLVVMWLLVSFGFVLLLLSCSHIFVVSVFFEVNSLVDNNQTTGTRCESGTAIGTSSSCNLRSAWWSCKNLLFSCELCTIILPSYATIDFNTSLGALYLAYGDNIQIKGGTESKISVNSYYNNTSLPRFIHYERNLSSILTNCSTTSLIITDITLSNFGNEYVNGGAIHFNGQGSMYLNRVRFLNNRGRYGGAVYINNNTDSVYISNCSFINNTATSGGGAIAIDSNTHNISILHTIITNNIANEGGGVYINNNNTAVSIHNTIVQHCHAYYSGGGILLVSNNPDFSLVYSTITYCTSGSTGGGVALRESNYYAQIVNCSIVYCSSTLQGGGIYLDSDNSHAIIQDTVIAYCKTTQDGGGLALQVKNYNILVVNTTISHCTAKVRGGGILLEEENFYMIWLDSTVEYCNATYGGGMFLSHGNNNVTIQDSVVQYNYIWWWYCTR